MFLHYKDMKGNSNAEIGEVWEVMGHPRSYGFLFEFNRK